MSDHRNTAHQQPNLFSEANATIAVKQTVKLPSYIKDHRKRLRERFINGGADAVPDYELLELVLFRAIPRQDVKPLARMLIETFGDFNGVLSAPQAQLLDVEGVGASVAVELKISTLHPRVIVEVRAFPTTIKLCVQYC